jgi:predicted CoA-binding protein
MTNVVVLGASPKPERYSFQAITRLLAAGYKVIPINPRGGDIQGLRVLPNLSTISDGIDTITLYVAPAQLREVAAEIVRIRPRRVIFNPGTESTDEEKLFSTSGIEVVKGCTLVMLATEAF